MKKKKRSFEKKLKAYSAVAAGTLLLAPSVSQAAVQYSGPMNLPVNPNNNVMVDMDGDTNTDARFFVNFYGSPTSNFINIDTYNYSATSLIANTNNTDPANLPSNYPIQNILPGPTNIWSVYTTSYNTLAGNLDGSTSASYGNFNTVGVPGYIGIRFPALCGTAFGWIQYRTDVLATQGTVIDWAYEDTCGPILAGDNGLAPAVSVPTLNQWGLFALIALLAGAGVSVLRKQEQG